MKKIFIPLMAAALVSGLSGLAVAEEGHEEAAPAAAEKAPAKGKKAKHAKAKHAKGKKAHDKSGCNSPNGCHAEEGAAAPADSGAAAPAAH